MSLILSRHVFDFVTCMQNVPLSLVHRCAVFFSLVCVECEFVCVECEFPWCVAGRFLPPDRNPIWASEA